jgi:drug/metabolite transporter (DMT)-like permease
MNLLLIVFLSTVWGSSYIAIKDLVATIDPIFAAFLRVVISLVATSLILLIFKKSFYVPKKDLWKPCLAGIFSAGLPYALSFLAQSRVSPGLGGILEGTAPIWAFGLSFIFIRKYEVFSWNKIAGFLLALFGIIFIFSKKISFTGSNSEFIGVVLYIFTAMSYGVSIVLTRKILNKDSTISFGGNLVYQYISGLVFLLILTAIMGEFSFRPEFLNFKSIGLLFYLSLVCTTLSLFLFFYLIRNIGSLKASVAPYLVPVMALTLDRFIKGNPPQTSEIIGVIFTVGGAALIEFDVYKLIKKLKSR